MNGLHNFQNLLVPLFVDFKLQLQLLFVIQIIIKVLRIVCLLSCQF